MLFMILCNLLLIVSNVKEPDQMPSVFGIRPAIVLSGSMEPTFYPGDVILLKKTKEPEELEVGDVVCYLYSGKATTHRITERFEADGKTRYVMKGDFNNVEDRLAVDPEQIQGVWTGGKDSPPGPLSDVFTEHLGHVPVPDLPVSRGAVLGYLKEKKRGSSPP